MAEHGRPLTRLYGLQVRDSRTIRELSEDSKAFTCLGKARIRILFIMRKIRSIPARRIAVVTAETLLRNPFGFRLGI
jgi:hypothetical protein